MDSTVNQLASLTPEALQELLAKVQQEREARQKLEQPVLQKPSRSSSGADDPEPAVSSSADSEGAAEAASEEFLEASGPSTASGSVTGESHLGDSSYEGGSTYSNRSSDSQSVVDSSSSELEEADDSSDDKDDTLSSGFDDGYMDSSDASESTDDSDSSNSSSEDSDIVIIPSLDQLTYRDEPLTPGLRAQLEYDLSQEVKYHGTCSLRDTINLPMFGPQSLTKAVEETGSVILLAPEQSGKTGAQAGLILTSSRMGHPTVVLIQDCKGNAEKVSEDLRSLLTPAGIMVMYVSGYKIWDTIASLSSSFQSGKLVLVMSAYRHDLERLNIFLEKHAMTGLTVIADESDNLWSTEINPNASHHVLRSQREREMYQLLGSVTNPIKRQNPLAQGSRVRCFIQVSATQIATIVWHCQWRLPFRFVCANKSTLSEKGYALERDLKLVAMLNPDDLKAGCEYGMRSEEVINELCKFAQDQRSGRLMLVCLSPYVRKQGAMTSFAIAEEILQKHVPDAICIVMHGGGVNALYNNIGASSSSAPDYSHGDGEAIYVDKKTHVRALAAAGSSRAGKRQRQQETRAEQAVRSKQASDAIKKFDRKFGLARPLIVIGYNVVGRCASIRSRKRVITHVIGAYQQGRSKADAEQMLLRSNGKSRQVRSKNGFDHVRMVTTEESFWIVQDLYNFTEEALRLSGTGRQEDLQAWYEADYPERYKPLFQDKHPWYRKTMGILDVSKITTGGQPISMQDPPMKKAAKRTCKKPASKRRKVDPESTGFRLMRCIWAVAEKAPDHQFARADVEAWMEKNPGILTREELVDRQHSGAWSAMSMGAHLFKKVNKKGSLFCLTEDGLKWCTAHLVPSGSPS